LLKSLLKPALLASITCVSIKDALPIFEAFLQIGVTLDCATEKSLKYFFLLENLRFLLLTLQPSQLKTCERREDYKITNQSIVHFTNPVMMSARTIAAHNTEFASRRLHQLLVLLLMLKEGQHCGRVA
jgi:hypothetical protein